MYLCVEEQDYQFELSLDGAEVVIQGKIGDLVGIDSKKRKYPIIVKYKDCKYVTITEDGIMKLLGIEDERFKNFKITQTV